MKKLLVMGLIALFCSCAGNPAPAQTAALTDQLDAAIREASDYLNNNVKSGNKLVILNIQSDYPALSEYIIDELIANTINDRKFSIVDRQQLDAIRAELNFQMSGEVDDSSAQRLGAMLGAQTIISGGVSKIGDMYRLRVRALSVESAQIEGQFNKNIPSGPTIDMLARSSASGSGVQTVQAQATRPASTTAQATAPVAPATPIINPRAYYYIQTAMAPDGSYDLCWDVPGHFGSTGPAAIDLQMELYHVNTQQERVAVDRLYRFADAGDGFMYIICKGGQYLEVNGGGVGTKVMLGERANNNRQKFKVTQESEDFFKITTFWGTVLCVNRNLVSTQRDSNHIGDLNQLWRFIEQ